MESTTKPTVTPELALELRLRFLETLIAGRPSNSSSTALPSHPTARSTPSLTRRADLAQSQLKEVLESSGSGGEAVRRFVQSYEFNEPLLRLPAINGSSAEGAESQLTTEARVALILESEAEIRALERDLREVETLDGRGVVEAGKLGEHEQLKPALEEIKTAVGPLSTSYLRLEDKASDLLEQYGNYITSMSELFIAWNDIVTEAEAEVTKLEKARRVEVDVV